MGCRPFNRVQLIVVAAASFMTVSIFFLAQSYGNKDSIVTVAIHDKYISEIQPKRSGALPQRCDRRNAERLIHLSERCLADPKPRINITALDKSKLSSIYVNDEHKVMYCRIPKTGCTNWKKYFILLSGKTNYESIDDIKGSDAHSGLFDRTVRNLSSYSDDQIADILSNYFKFVVVRNPLTRLLSAYLNKLSKFNPAFNYTTTKILRYNGFYDTVRTVTFEEFLSYLTNPVHDNTRSNDHWMRYTELCFPCTIKYDYVAQIETMADDARYIIQKINSTYPFPQRQPIADSRTEAAYANITQTLNSMIRIAYTEDLDLFGYNC